VEFKIYKVFHIIDVLYFRARLCVKNNSNLLSKMCHKSKLTISQNIKLSVLYTFVRKTLFLSYSIHQNGNFYS